MHPGEADAGSVAAHARRETQTRSARGGFWLLQTASATAWARQDLPGPYPAPAPSAPASEGPPAHGNCPIRSAAYIARQPQTRRREMRIDLSGTRALVTG